MNFHRRLLSLLRRFLICSTFPQATDCTVVPRSLLDSSVRVRRFALPHRPCSNDTRPSGTPFCYSKDALIRANVSFSYVIVFVTGYVLSWSMFLTRVCFDQGYVIVFCYRVCFVMGYVFDQGMFLTGFVFD